MALIGVIAGYVIASASGPGSVANNPTPVAPTPAAPSAPAPAPTADNVPKVDPDVDNIRGDKGATISVIEYSDFECPFCKRHHATMLQLIDEIDDVNWVYRHYPLQSHPNAQGAAEASECAGDQGKFWEFSDLLFANGVTADKYGQYAQELGLNMTQFNDCYNSSKYADKVSEQMAGGSANGVRGTPGNIVINNKTGKTQIVSGAQPISAFKAAIEALR